MRDRLFSLSEEFGICPSRRSVYDEVWSDFVPKRRSSRFWPQCERIKAAIQFAAEAEAATGKDAANFVHATDEGVSVLLRYFATRVPGLWFDRWNDTGDFVQQPAKASSLYHIIGALSEYLRARPRIQETRIV